MPEYPAFDEEGFEEYGFSFTLGAPSSSTATAGAGHVDRIRVYKRTPFLDNILVTGAIQKPFEEQLYLDAAIVHQFTENLYLTVTPVKPFTESLYLDGAINIMDWVYTWFPVLEELRRITENQSLIEARENLMSIANMILDKMREIPEGDAQ